MITLPPQPRDSFIDSKGNVSIAWRRWFESIQQFSDDTSKGVSALDVASMMMAPAQSLCGNDVALIMMPTTQAQSGNDAGQTAMIPAPVHASGDNQAMTFMG